MSEDMRAELSSIVLVDQPLGAVLRRVAEVAVRAIPGADDASVTLTDRGRAMNVAFCGQLAVTLDERQYESGFGPAVAAAYGEQVISIDTKDDAGVYAGFARQARRKGVSHVLALGLPALEHIRGALSLYTFAGGPLARADREVAAFFARHAAVTITNATAYCAARDEVAQMKEAMASRAVIEQAKGLIIMQEQCGSDAAFAVLARISSLANRKVRDVAREIVDQARSSGSLPRLGAIRGPSVTPVRRHVDRGGGTNDQ